MLRILRQSAVLAWGVLALSLPFSALASAIVQSAQGDVRANGKPVALNQRLTPGTALTTGANSQLVMRFDDNQRVVLNQNTEFRIVDFRFNEKNPGEDRSVFDLVKGALRVVTGTVGRRSPNAFQLRAPQATIGVRGTDFMVTIVNPLYLTVVSGSIGVTNAAGTLVLGAGAFGTVASTGVLGVTIPASALPGAASGAFGTMGAVPGVGAGAGAGAAGSVAGGSAAGAGTAVGGTAAGVGVGVAAGVAAAAAAASTSNSDSTPVPTTTHHP
jgi:hypothetical protein